MTNWHAAIIVESGGLVPEKKGATGERNDTRRGCRPAAADGIMAATAAGITARTGSGDGADQRVPPSRGERRGRDAADRRTWGQPENAPRSGRGSFDGLRGLGPAHRRGDPGGRPEAERAPADVSSPLAAPCRRS